PDATTPQERAGIDALCLYALLQTSRTSNDPRLSIKGEFMTSALAKLKAMKIESSQELNAPVTYARSLRAAALAVYDRPEDKKQLSADVQWLTAAACDGAYTYDDRYSHDKRFHTSYGPRAESEPQNPTTQATD